MIRAIRNTTSYPTLEQYRTDHVNGKSWNTSDAYRMRLEFEDDVVNGHALVSIVTVVRNAEKTLPKTMLSVFAQTYPAIEYIVVDGGSSDGTTALIQEHSDKIDAWISEPDGGIYDGFNKGAAASTGRMILFLNADDWLSPNQIEEAVGMIESSGADFSFGDITLHEYQGQDIHLPGEPGYARRVRDQMPALHQTTCLCQRHIFETIGLFRTDLRIASDYDWFIRTDRQGFRGIYSPKIHGHMRAGGVSTTQQTLAIREGFICAYTNGAPLIRSLHHWGGRYLGTRYSNSTHFGRAARRLAAASQPENLHGLLTRIHNLLGPAKSLIPGKSWARRKLGVAVPGQLAINETAAKRLQAFVEARSRTDGPLSEAALEWCSRKALEPKDWLLVGNGPAVEQVRIIAASGNGHVANQARLDPTPRPQPDTPQQRVLFITGDAMAEAILNNHQVTPHKGTTLAIATDRRPDVTVSVTTQDLGGLWAFEEPSDSNTNY